MTTKHRVYAVLLLFVCITSCAGLKCYNGNTNRSGTIDDFKTSDCLDHEELCFSLHATDLAGLELKSCWNTDWENGRYQKLGCIRGEHCIGGTCYNDTTVCTCNEDMCNGWLEHNGTVSTVIPYPPTFPPDLHTCYYGVKENNQTTGMEYIEECYNTEQLCVRVTNETDGYEYRSCWDSKFNMEYSRPGCYKGFNHCHRDTCHNDTLICVCAENNCNVEGFTTDAPPITPGSGLYCYAGSWEEEKYTPKECNKGENFCIEATSGNSTHVYRDCWNPESYNKFNYTGCETTQSCFEGQCFNATVCVCDEDLCNDFGVAGRNGTTPVPVTMTTTNMTMHCWYGIHHNETGPEKEWISEECAPQEDRCILITSDDGFAMGQCYDKNYNNGVYNSSGTYETGEHCFRGRCHNGTIFICPEPLCNDVGASTPAPHPTTPGSGLDCYYGEYDDHHPDANLTTQICQKNETLCLAVYGDEENFFMASCWDPTQEEGRYNSTDGCLYGLHCWHHDDGDQDCHNGTVCTCDDNMCNNRTAWSTLPTESTPTTVEETMRCWFGEKHPSTGKEDWKVEVCESTEHYCYQLVRGTGDGRYESRQCWDLAYEEGRYDAAGCYKGQVCHHEHCFNHTTVCICKSPECNDWTVDGNVTTVVPATDGSGLLCYSGDQDNHEVKPCSRHETTCMGYTQGGNTIANCYDPQTNDGKFNTDGCWDNVDIEQTEDHGKGTLCLCSEEDLCNQKYLSGKAASLTLPSFLILIASSFIIIN